MTQSTTHHTTDYQPSAFPPPVVPPRVPAIPPPTLSWPDFTALATEITTFSTTSHTITWHIALGQAFLAISWEQSAQAEHSKAWRAWSYDLSKTAAEHHDDARYNLTQAAASWSRAARALTRALLVRRAPQSHEEAQHDPSFVLDDVAQCYAFSRFITEQQDRIRHLTQWLDRERLTTSIAGYKPVLRVASQQQAAESEASHERS